MPKPQLVDRFTVEPGRVIVRGNLALEIIYDTGSDRSLAGQSGFAQLFDVLRGQVKGNWLGSGSLDNLVPVTAVIRRRSDGVLFGYGYLEDLSGGETRLEPNGEAHGFDPEAAVRFDVEPDPDDYDFAERVYVWLPVEPVTITGYRLIP